MKNGNYNNKSITEKLFYFFCICLLGKIFFSGLSYYISLWILNVDLASFTQLDGFNNSTIRSYKIAALLDQLGTFLIPAATFCWLFISRPNKLLNFHKLELTFLYTLPFIFIIMVISSSFLLELNHNIDFSFLGEKTITLIKDNQQKMDQLHYSFIGITNKSLIFNFFLMALLPAICEEIVFRGILQSLFTKWSKNIHLGILLSALVFALLHFQFYNIIPLLLLGTLLGYTMAMTNNIWSSILLHFTYNSFSIISIYCEKKEIQFDQVINLNNSYFNLLALFISIFLLFFIWRKNNYFKKTKENYLA